MLLPPTQNSKLKQINGDFQTITDALDYAALGETGLSFYNTKGAIEASASYTVLRNSARDTALKLLSLRLSRGQRVGIIAETSLDYFAIFYGCQYAGLIPCPIPYTTYMGGKGAYLERIKSLAEVAQISLICVPQSLENMCEEIATLAATDTLTFDQLGECDGQGKILPLGADEPAYIQFSSGSTSEPKGIIVTQSALSSNVKGILQECIRIAPNDRAFSWLPLYHDMGMVGFALAPLFAQISVDFISPVSFARSPTLWLELMSRNSSTITYAPPFGYELAAKRYIKTPLKLDLSSLRLAGIGGDTISPKVLDLFTQTLLPTQFKSAALTPSYGMAETTLLISYSHGVSIDVIDNELLETGQLVAVTQNKTTSKQLAICGKPLNGHDLIVLNTANERLADREIGRIVVRGPSVAKYYITANGIISMVDEAGYLDTGDMGYMLDGEIVITGRYKEMILLNGRNLWPQDIEKSVIGLSSSPIKRAVAFSLDKDEGTQIIVLAEYPIATEETYRAVKQAISTQLLASSGISAQIELVAPRSLPYTSSGKLARLVAKLRFISGDWASA